MSVRLTEMPTNMQLKMARTATGLSRGDVAQAINYSVSNLANVEERNTSPKLDTLKALVSLYTSKGVEFGTDGWVRVVK